MILRRSRSAAAIGAWSSTWARRWRHRREPNRCRELRIVASPRRLDQTGRHGWGCHRWMLHPIPLLLRRRAIPPPRSEHTAIMVIAEPGCAVQAITGGIHAREPRRIEKPTPAGGYPGSLQYRRAQFRASAGGRPTAAAPPAVRAAASGFRGEPVRTGADFNAARRIGLQTISSEPRMPFRISRRCPPTRPVRSLTATTPSWGTPSRRVWMTLFGNPLSHSGMLLPVDFATDDGMPGVMDRVDT
jgi:hypothetical protein